MRLICNSALIFAFCKLERHVADEETHYSVKHNLSKQDRIADGLLVKTSDVV